ncbi:MAG TPA: DUF1553 domain-containing protein, partial [Planctomycetota bacterium]|nr:DUF1553 domain-containing protein [Planctomycetota bacterium]
AELDALRFSDRLRVTPARYGAGGARKIHRFLVDAFRENMPYDELARRILTASGSDADAPEAGFWRAVSDAEDASEAVAQAFLGIRMQCAKCHNHPTERFTQDDYHGLKAVFAQTRTKRGRGSDVTVVYTDSTVEIRHPRTGEVVAPAVPLGGRLERTGADEDDRRVRFANWLVAPENPLFSRVEANRIWAALFGRGIVDPPDDFRDSNPPSNPELLDFLANELARSGFDRRHLVRLILTSRTWQRSIQSGEFSEEEPIYFSRARPRLLEAEILFDAIHQVAGVPIDLPGSPAGHRSVELAVAREDTGFLRVFGQPPRETVCLCERPAATNLSQALRILNGAFVNERIEHSRNRIRARVEEGASDEAIIEELWLAALSRKPSADELTTLRSYIDAKQSRSEALEDVMWTVLASREFLFWH